MKPYPFFIIALLSMQSCHSHRPDSTILRTQAGKPLSVITQAWDTFSIAPYDTSSDRAHSKLRGRVRNITEMKYPLEGTNSFYGGYGNSDFLERHYTSFDRRGMWREVLFYAPMYSADQKTFYLYDSTGHLVEERTYSLRDEFKNTIKYEYDNRGNRTRETSYNGQEKICETVRKFDADNHLIDEKVQCVNEIHTGPEMRVKYTKSKKGTKEEYYNAEDESKSNSLVTLYDDRGNIIEKETLDYRDKVSNKTTYKYDGRNNKIEEVHYENPKLRMVTEIRYDDRGNQIADSNYNNVNNVGWYSRNSYVYDTAGNWIENTYVYLGQRIYIIKRQINYY